MPRPTVLGEIAKKQNMTEEEVLADALGRSDGKIDAAATLLKVYPNVIRTALARHGLKVVTEVKVRLEKADA